MIHSLLHDGGATVDRFALAALLAAAIAAVAWRLRALSTSGAIAAFAIGTAAYGSGGLPVAAALVAFFATGSALSRIKHPRAEEARAAAQKGSTRDALQVLANGFAAALCAVVSSLVPADRAAPWAAAAIGAIAVAAADTWATEIGAFSKALPRSIRTWRTVPAGASGGITWLGTAASILGGAAIGGVAALFSSVADPWRWIAFGASVGFAGSMVDSWLGATAQGAWRCDECGARCEAPQHRCSARARLVSGFAWLDNDGVNAVSTFAGAALGWAFSTAFF